MAFIYLFSLKNKLIITCCKRNVQLLNVKGVGVERSGLCSYIASTILQIIVHLICFGTVIIFMKRFFHWKSRFKIANRRSIRN